MCECIFCHKEQIITDFVYEDELLAHLMIMSKKVVAALKEIYHPGGYSIMQRWKGVFWSPFHCTYKGGLC